MNHQALNSELQASNSESAELPFADEVRRARLAQNEWLQISPGNRVRFVRNLRGLLARHGMELALNVTQDFGRTADEVLATDVLPTADACRFLEQNASRVLRPQHLSNQARPLWLFGSRETIHRRPHGIVAIIGTWNYPIFLNMVQILQALVAGNAVLWKPSEVVPATSRRIKELFDEAGFPKDLLIMLPATREAGPQLAEAEIDHLIFTGSAAVGRKLAKRLGERLISSTLELSGCDAMIVMHNADLDLASKAAYFGSTLNKGQTCIAVRRVFVQRDRYDEFVGRLKVLHKNHHPEVLALFGQAQQAESLVKEAISQGAKLLNRHDIPRAEDDPPRFPITILYDATPEMQICQEATFGPLMMVLPFNTLADVVEMHKRCDYGLGASIFAAYPETARQLAASLEVGMVTINDVMIPTAHPATPFGGRGRSGWGVTQGKEGLLAMTVPQVVVIRNGSFRPHYDNGSTIDDGSKQMVHGMLKWSHSKGLSGIWAGIREMIRGGIKNWRRRGKE